WWSASWPSSRCLLRGGGLAFLASAPPFVSDITTQEDPVSVTAALEAGRPESARDRLRDHDGHEHRGNDQDHDHHDLERPCSHLPLPSKRSDSGLGNNRGWSWLVPSPPEPCRDHFPPPIGFGGPPVGRIDWRLYLVQPPGAGGTNRGTRRSYWLPQPAIPTRAAPGHGRRLDSRPADPHPRTSPGGHADRARRGRPG